MALKAAGKPAQLPNADGSVPEVPDEIPRHGRDGRPKIRVLRPDGTTDPLEAKYYTRASTLGKTLENTYGIEQWKLRMVAYGIGHDRALHLAAASVPGTTEDAHKAELARIAEEALTISRAGSGAMRGTALHHLSEQRDAGADLRHLPADALAALDAYSALMGGFEVISAEEFVVCDELETAGTFDRLVSPRWPMEAPDGSTIEPGDRLILDLKTNKEAKYFGPTYSCQQAVYAFGRPYSHRDGRGEWPPCDPPYDVEQGPRTDWALILHVPIESPEDAGLHWVDLTEGMELAQLAVTVRAQRNRKDLFYPCEPPREPRPAAIEQAGLVARIRQASSMEALDQLYEQHAAEWTPECGEAADARADELERAA